jgi:homoserine acetyltransferase
MAEGKLPKISLKWMPKQKKARGIPKKNWMDAMRKAINERNLNEGQWEDSKQRSQGVGQRRKVLKLIYRVSQKEYARLWENVPYVNVHPKHLYSKLNGYGDNGQKKVWSSCSSTYCTR